VDLNYRESNGSFYNEQKYVNTQQNSHELKKADVESSYSEQVSDGESTDEIQDQMNNQLAQGKYIHRKNTD
jgi:competence protein ComGC